MLSTASGRAGVAGDQWAGGGGDVRSGTCLGRTRTTRAVTVRVDLESVTLSEITSQEFTYVRHLKLETHEAGRS